MARYARRVIGSPPRSEGRQFPACGRASISSSPLIVSCSRRSSTTASRDDPTLDEDGGGPLPSLGEQAAHLLVDDELGALGVGPALEPVLAQVGRSPRPEPDRSESGEKPQSRTILMAELGRPGKVAGRPGRRLAQDEDLGGTTTQADRQRIAQVALGVQVPLVGRQLLGHPERLTGGQDRDLGHRIGVLAAHGDQGVPGLVDGDGTLLAGKQGIGRIAGTEQDAVARVVEIDGGDDVTAVPDGDDRGLVDEVGEIGAGEARRPSGDRGEVDVGAQVLAPERGWSGWPSARTWLGSGISTWRSKRPGRRSAGSSTSGRLVAAITTTPAAGSKPSISARS